MDDKHEQSQKLNTRDKITFSIAFLILGSFFLFYGITLGVNLYSGSTDYAGIEKVASTLAPIAAAVIGYYFGQRPVRALADKLQEAARTTGVAAEAVQGSEDVTETMHRQIEGLNQTILNQEQTITEQQRAMSNYLKSIEALEQILKRPEGEGKPVKEGKAT
jgi:hypothetical protein